MKQINKLVKFTSIQIRRWAFRNLKRQAQVAKRFNKLFLAIAQLALRFKENKSCFRFIALRTKKIYNSAVRIIAVRTEKNLVVCALLRCALLKVEILRCALSD